MQKFIELKNIMSIKSLYASSVCCFKAVNIRSCSCLALLVASEIALSRAAGVRGAPPERWTPRSTSVLPFFPSSSQFMPRTMVVPPRGPPQSRSSSEVGSTNIMLLEIIDKQNLSKTSKCALKRQIDRSVFWACLCA